MKIGKLKQNCGNCGVIEFCGDPFCYCLCADERFKKMEETEYKKLAENIGWSDFEPHPPCRGCNGKCDECDEGSEARDVLVEFIADKVAAQILQRFKEVCG